MWNMLVGLLEKYVCAVILYEPTVWTISVVEPDGLNMAKAWTHH